ncbi:MAG: hypothetical protein M3Q65_18275, partial [Chloroflexota bacterium]|nr:hypothetical protein [Chloroflexota bacterium]
MHITPARYHRAGFLAGLIASAAFTGAEYALARGFGLSTLPELAAYRLIALLPLSLFSFFVGT